MKKLLGAAVVAASLAWAAPASAATVVGGYAFDDNAFADTLISSFGSFTTVGGSLAAALTDIDVGTYAFSGTSGSYVELGFTDNTLVNGAGADLVLFELGVPDTFSVSITIGGTTRSYLSTNTGGSAGGFALNAAAIDLDDFGYAIGASLSSIVIGLSTPSASGTVPSLALVGALNSGPVGGTVPEPGSLALAALALLGVGATARRRKS